MGWDPETGQWEPDVHRQPLGALGAAMSFWNARKARDISGDREQARALALQQHQEALEQERFQFQQAREQAQRDQELREALAQVPPGASIEDLTGVYMRKGGDTSKLMPLWRTGLSGEIRTNLQDIKGKQGSELEEQKQGGRLELEQERQGGRTDLETQRQTGRVEIQKMKDETARLVAAVRAKKAKNVPLTKSEKVRIANTKLSYRKAIEAIESKRDPMTLKLGAVDQENLKDLKNDLDSLDDEMAEAAAAATGSPTKPAVDSSDPLNYFSKKP